MKKILLVLIIFINICCVYSQTLKFGGTANFLTSNKYLEYQFGPSFIAEYSLKDIPISLQGSARFYLSELSNENNFSGNHSYNVFSAGISIIYYPFNWAIEPYLGAGVYYNSNNTTLDGNIHPFENGTYQGFGNLKNNFSEELTAGIKFSAQTSINFVIEVTQTFNKPEYDLVVWNSSGIIKSEKAKFNFNSLFIKLGLLFQI